MENALVCTGNGTVISNVDVPDASNADGPPDGSYASLYQSNDAITLDLGTALAAATVITVTYEKISGSGTNPNLVIQSSTASGSGFSAVAESPISISTGTGVIATFTVTVPAGHQYLEIETTNGIDLGIDGISFTCPSGGGTTAGNLSCAAGATEITGIVYEDFDFDGLYDAGEIQGLENITVTATDSLGNSFTETTNSTGAYTFTGLEIDRTYRLEFTNIPSWAQSTFFAGDNGTTVQFAMTGNCANLSLASPADYCQANPNIIVPCYINGDNSGTDDVLVTVPYSSTGLTPSGKTTISEANQIASTWGVAYDEITETAYISAILKRHAGLTSAGLDAIFAVDPLIGTTNGTLWLELTDSLGIDVGQSLVGTNTARGLSGLTDLSYDVDAYSLVGTVGIGDMDISDDNQSLYLVNIYQNTLLEIDIATKSIINIDTLNVSCTNGTFRMWAVEYHKGNIYVGGVCDAMGSQDDADLEAKVFQLSGGVFTEVLSTPLDYDRGLPFNADGCKHLSTWEPWDNSIATSCKTFASGTHAIVNPQPILSDIEIDVNGDMILGFIDRAGLQWGSGNYSPDTGDTDLYSVTGGGDILRACNNGATWLIEDAATTCENTSGNALGDGEFYGGDFYSTNGNTKPHQETSFGSLVLLPGSGEVVLSAYDPVDGPSLFGRGGLIKLSNTSGNKNAATELYGASSVGDFGKGLGLGDLQLLCNPAPIEIGNYVWIDTNEDGIQDAGEPSVDSILVELYDAAGNLIATDTTDANGQYYFSSDATDNAIWVTTDDGLDFNTDYYIVAGGNGQYSNGEITIDGAAYTLTVTDNATGPNADLIDNDGTIATGIDPDFDGEPYLQITTGNAGEVNHTYDFGFIPAPICTDPILSTLTFENICFGDNFTVANVTTSVTNGVSVTYQWYDNNGANNSGNDLIVGETAATLNSLPSAVGSYSYLVEAINTLDANCLASEIVDLVINMNPTTTASSIDPTCTGSTINNDGTITLVGFTTEKYDMVTGSSYTGSVTYASATTIPAGGVITNTLANPSTSQDYTIRIFSSDDCFVDRTVTISNVECCGPNICLPINVTINRAHN